jgi:hypothetical protein
MLEGGDGVREPALGPVPALRAGLWPVLTPRAGSRPYPPACPYPRPPPALPPVNACPEPSPAPSHDSVPRRLATPYRVEELPLLCPARFVLALRPVLTPCPCCLTPVASVPLGTGHQELDSGGLGFASDFAASLFDRPSLSSGTSAGMQSQEIPRLHLWFLRIAKLHQSQCAAMASRFERRARPLPS